MIIALCNLHSKISDLTQEQIYQTIIVSKILRGNNNNMMKNMKIQNIQAII